MEKTIVAALTDFKGIEIAITTSDIAKQKGPLVDKVRNNHHASRSGDIYVIQEPYWFLFDEGPIPSMHGSPWRYDTHVPIIFVGPGINAKKVHRKVHPVDVAPTMAAFLGMSPPGASQGTILKEVFH